MKVFDPARLQSGGGHAPESWPSSAVHRISMERDSKPTGAKPMSHIAGFGTGNVKVKAEPRSFTVADKSLIDKLHGFMPAEQLLFLLNDRLQSDIGQSDSLYTMAQLREEIAKSHGNKANASDWGSVRRLLARASREGILAGIDEQVISDFAVVFALSARQELHLKEVVLSARRSGK